MATRGRKPAPPDYTKILEQAQQELLIKKKALVQAERVLARSKQKHDELIAEVARLDMVERSLKALVDGTEPPANIKYIYNYPTWVWFYPSYPNYTYPVYYNPPTWITTPTITCQGQGNWQSGITTTSGTFTNSDYQYLTSAVSNNLSVGGSGNALQSQSSVGFVVDLSTNAEVTDILEVS